MEKMKASSKRTKRTTTTNKSTLYDNTNDKTKKKKTNVGEEIPPYSKDDASLNDGVDYSLEENYAIKKFVGYKEAQKKKRENQYTYSQGGRDSEISHPLP
jgi:hypothetical protein